MMTYGIMVMQPYKCGEIILDFEPNYRIIAMEKDGTSTILYDKLFPDNIGKDAGMNVFEKLPIIIEWFNSIDFIFNNF